MLILQYSKYMILLKILHLYITNNLLSTTLVYLSMPIIFKGVISLTLTLLLTSNSFAAEVLPGRKKTFEGFSSNSRSAIFTIRKELQTLLKEFNSASEIWYELHLNLDEGWLNQIEFWPDDQNFREYVLKSQATTVENKTNGTIDVGFSAFHDLKDYDRAHEIYKDQKIPSFATGLELLEGKSKPLISAQFKGFLIFYYYVNEVYETITTVKLNLEILKDQVTSLEFSKSNSYYIKQYTTESSSFLISLENDIDQLFNKVMSLRTNVLFPAHEQLLGMVYGVSTVSYRTTSEFKADILLAAQKIESATPELSKVSRQFEGLILKLSLLQERNQLEKTFTEDQSSELELRVEKLFSELTNLLHTEQNKLTESQPHKKWATWFSHNNSKYSALFYELFEILEYNADPGSALYQFQTQHFKLNSKNRELYRGLESLIFGTINSYDNSSSKKASSDQSKLKMIIKFRSTTINRMVRKQTQEVCNQILSN